MAAKSLWTPEKDELIKQLYAEGVRVKDMPSKVGICYASIYKRLTRLKVKVNRHVRYDAVTDAIIKNNPTLPAWKVAKRLAEKGIHRTIPAIRYRRYELRIVVNGAAKTGFSAEELSELLGVAPASVVRWCKKSLLKYRYLKSPDAQKGQYLIAESSVKSFILDNPAKIDLSKVDKFWFIDFIGASKARGTMIQDTCGKGDNSGLSEMQLLN